jgi:hypothetical protein
MLHALQDQGAGLLAGQSSCGFGTIDALKWSGVAIAQIATSSRLVKSAASTKCGACIEVSLI